jgi:hypothetical protein
LKKRVRNVRPDTSDGFFPITRANFVRGESPSIRADPCP